MIPQPFDKNGSGHPPISEDSARTFVCLRFCIFERHATVLLVLVLVPDCDCDGIDRNPDVVIRRDQSKRHGSLFCRSATNPNDRLLGS